MNVACDTAHMAEPETDKFPTTRQKLQVAL